MHAHNKKSFWNNTIIYGVGFVLLRSVSFLLLPLYTNLLSAKEVGWIFILYTILAFLNTLYSHGMDSSLLKFYKKTSSQNIISTSILYSIIYGFVISIFLFLVYQKFLIMYFKIPDIISNYIILSILFILILDMLSSRAITLVRLLNNPYYYLFVCFSNVLVSLVLNVYFISFLGLGFMGALFALACVSGVQFLLLVPLILKNFKFSLFDIILLKKMLKFSLPFLPAAIFFILIEMCDRWMLGWYKGIQEVGLYGAGYKVGGLMLLVVRSFNLNWQPFYLSQNQHNLIPSLETIGTKTILFLIYLGSMITIGWPLLFAINFNSYYIIGHAFIRGGNIIPIIVLSYLFYGIFILQMPSIYLKNKQRWVPLFWGAGFFINVCANAYLIPKYGIYGAAGATLLAYLSMAILLIYKNSVWMRIKYNNVPILLFSCVSILAYLVSLKIDSSPWSLWFVFIAYSLLGGFFLIYILKTYFPSEK